MTSVILKKIFVICLTLLFLASCSTQPNKKVLILATTTSLQDTGLLDYLIPQFEQKYGVQVKTVAVGSGKALKIAQQGDADVLLVHSPDRERQFMKAGFGKERVTFMHNYYIIVGPKSDLAKVAETKGAPQALKKIADTKQLFVSRGDESGTHLKELELWSKAKIKPKTGWYIESGQGMGATLMLANQKSAYTLSDESTFLAFRSKIKLVLLLKDGKELVNRYSVITVNGRKANYRLARLFMSWLTSRKLKQEISNYGKERYGKAIFVID